MSDSDLGAAVAPRAFFAGRGDVPVEGSLMELRDLRFLVVVVVFSTPRGVSVFAAVLVANALKGLLILAMLYWWMMVFFSGSGSKKHIQWEFQCGNMAH